MASRYQFSEAEIGEIEQARKGNKNKRVEARLKALELRAKGAKAKEVSEKTGFHAGSVTRLVAWLHIKRRRKASRQSLAIIMVAITAI